MRINATFHIFVLFTAGLMFSMPFKGKVTFPIGISIVADTDTIAIAKSTALLPTKKGRKISGRIHTVEFYTVSSAN